MDPASAIGLAAAISQLAVYSIQVLGKSRKLYKSSTGNLIAHHELEIILTRFQRHLSTLGDEKSPLRELAQEAQQVTAEIMELVKKLRGKHGSNKVWNSLRQGLLSVSRESELQELEQRIERYRRHMDTLVIGNLREYVVKIQQHQKADSKQVQDYFEIILKALRRDRAGFHTIELLPPRDGSLDSPVPANFATQILDNNEQEANTSLQKTITNLLHFEDIDVRRETIPEAYRTTFDWIYRKPAMQESGYEWADFRQWLQSNDNLYWIAGKPGAGKSTLMKYLYTNTQTDDLARRWPTKLEPSGKWDLSSAGFFFWNSGSPIQRSRVGFLRAMLTQLWTNEMDAADVFPRRWQRSELLGLQTEPLTEQELLQAMKIVLSMHGHYFLLFIDGLDEFEGSKIELADIVLDFSCMERVKVCVASRPWAEFQSKFQNKPQLLMEHLTRADIVKYIEGEFGASVEYQEMKNFEPDGAKQLKDEIIAKASGVFLWVYVVVSNLLDGMMSGDRMDILLEKLDRLPPRLNDLFSSILEQVSPDHAKEASELFQFVHAYPEDSKLIALHWSQLTFDRVVGVEVAPLSEPSADYHAKRMQRNLVSRCKCLLDARPPVAPTTKVTWLHRTVREYLVEEVWDRIKEQSAEYDVSSALTFSLLHQAKARTTALGQELEHALQALLKAASRYQIVISTSDIVESGGRHIAFMDDVEKIGTRLGKDLNGPNEILWLPEKDYPTTVSGLTGRTTVFHLALVYQWTWYIEHRLALDGKLIEVNVASNRRIDSLMLTAELDLWDSQRVCLEYGADVKKVQATSLISIGGGTTAWQVTLEHLAKALQIASERLPWLKALHNVVLFLKAGADPQTKLARGQTEDVISQVVGQAKANASGKDDVRHIASCKIYLKGIYSRKRALKRLF